MSPQPQNPDAAPAGKAGGSTDESPGYGAALLVIGGFLAARLACAALIPLLRVETYYWTWSRALALGYKDHPPVVALLLRLVSPLLDDSALGLRLGHVIISTIGSFLFYRLCLRFVRPRAALACLVALSFAPFWFPFGVAVTPDGPLLFFWVIALACFHRATGSNSLWPWIATGVATGLTILSKYNGFLLPPAYLAFLLINDQGRRHLRSVRPYAALLVVLVLIAPNLVWNFQHGNSTAATPFREGIVPAEALKNFGLYILLPFGLLLPPIAAAWIRQTYVGLRSGRLWKDPAFQFFFCFSWLPFSAFAAVSLLTLVHFHWPATCMLMALPLTFENLGRPGKGCSPRCLRWTILSSVAILVVAGLVVGISLLVLRPVPGARKQRGLRRLQVELYGWQALQDRLDAELARHAGGPPFFLASSNFHFTSHIEWRTRQRVPTFPIDPDHRRQYDNWHTESDFLGQDALLFEPAPMASWKRKDILDSFRSVDELEPITATVRGVEVPRFEVWWCRDYLGSKKEAPGS